MKRLQHSVNQSLMVQNSKFSISITPDVSILAALMLMLIPFPWLLAWVLAALVHELFHGLAVLIMGKRIYHIEIGMDGARMQAGLLSDLETLICSLAGPLGALALISIASWFPKLALCAIIQSSYNLIPIYPLDGGRALLSLGRMLFSERAVYNLCLVVKTAVVSGFLFLGVFAAFIWKLGLLPLVFAILLILRTKKIKIPCK